MCLGGSSDNSAMINQQKAEADEARGKEEARKARIAQGLGNIKAMFEGGNTYSTTGGTPASTTAATTKQVWVPGATGGGGGNPNSTKGGSYGTNAGQGGYYKTVTVPGTAVAATPGQQVVTGTQAGFGEDFFNKFRDSINNYYLPQVKQQFGDAFNELTYRLVRNGLGQSSAGNTEYADLTEQNKLNEANVKGKADTATAGLKKSVSDARTAAEAQLYATENPDVVANSTLANIRNISATEPDLSPLADVFNVASVGGAGALKGYQNAKYRAQVPGYNSSGATSIVS